MTWLERVGILNHKLTNEEVDIINRNKEVLLASYMRQEIDLKTFISELEKSPKTFSAAGLAQELNYKG